MAERRSSGPYIWVTWLTKLLVGENSCEWAGWFKAQHEGWSWQKVPSDFDHATWHLEHTALMGRVTDELEAEGKAVSIENQNSFTLQGRTAALGGKPDLITVYEGVGTIIEAKTGAPSPAHHAQAMIYMYAVPKSLPQYEGLTFDGKVVYQDHEEHIPSSAIDQTFIDSLSGLIRRLSSATPARKVPSAMECGFCNITREECPERASGDTIAEGSTEDF